MIDNVNDLFETERVLGTTNRIVPKDKTISFRKLLDIDFTDKWNKFKPKDKEFIIRLLTKIIKCKNFLGHNFKYSSFKGCHIELFCRIDCDICRMCYDDAKHFEYDMNRPDYARNIAFASKEKIKIG